MDKENASSSSQNVQSSPFDLEKKRQQLIDYSSVAACVVNDEMQKADAESQAQKIFKADVCKMLTDHRQDIAFLVATKKEREREGGALEQEKDRSRKRLGKEKRRYSAAKQELKNAQSTVADLKHRIGCQKRNEKELEINRPVWERAAQQREFTEQQMNDEIRIMQNEKAETEQQMIAMKAELKHVTAEIYRYRTQGPREEDLPQLPRSPRPLGDGVPTDEQIECWRRYKKEVLEFFVEYPTFLPALCHKYFDGPIIPQSVAEEIVVLDEDERRERIEHIIVEHEIEHSGGRARFEAKRDERDRMLSLATRWHEWVKRHRIVDTSTNTKVRFSFNLNLNLTFFRKCFKLWRLQTLRERQTRQRELLQDSAINAAASTVDFGSSIQGESSQGGTSTINASSLMGTATMNSLPMQPTIHENSSLTDVAGEQDQRQNRRLNTTDSLHLSGILEPLPSERDSVQVRRIMSARLPAPSIVTRHPSTARGSSAAPTRFGEVRHASEARLGTQSNPIHVSHSVPRAAHPVARNMSSAEFRTMPATARTVRPSPLITSRQQPSSARMPSAPISSLTRTWSTVHVPPQNITNQRSAHFPAGGVGVMRSATTGRPNVTTTTRVPPPYPSFAGQVMMAPPPHAHPHGHPSHRPLFVPSSRQSAGPPPRVTVTGPPPKQTIFKPNAPIPPKRTISKPFLVQAQSSVPVANAPPMQLSSPFPQPSPCRPLQMRNTSAMRENAADRGMPRERIELAVQRASSLEQFVRPILDLFG